MKNSVLVIGGAGRLGSLVCAKAAEQNWQPVVIDNLSTGQSERVRFGPLVKAEAKESARISRSMKEYNIRHVIHCAMISEGENIFSQNIENTLGLIQALRDAGGTHFVISASSPKTYSMIEQITKDCATTYGFNGKVLNSSPNEAFWTKLFSDWSKGV